MITKFFKDGAYAKFVLVVIIVASFSYDGLQYWQMRKQNLALLSQVETLENTLANSQKDLSSTKDENEKNKQALQVAQDTNVNFQNQIENIASTVGVLTKLSQTDPELLKKYSKVYFLNENYIPKKLTTIPEQYTYEKGKVLQIQTEVWPHLEQLLESAKASGITIQVISAYRSFGAQAGLKSSYKVTYGAGTANSFSADQGYSEHQLGTTLDFTTQSVGATLSGFDKTDAYKWLLSNAYRYGFILSYPKNNSYYIFEPWHFRFVGTGLASYLNNQGLSFYDVDQRTIDQYLVNFFD